MVALFPAMVFLLVRLRRLFVLSPGLALCLLIWGCAGAERHPGITMEFFGRTPAGEEAKLFVLANGRGMAVGITNYGGIVTKLVVPDRAGRFGDVVLGHYDLKGYEKHPYFGALIGRYANRIAKGKFNLAGREYTLATNNGPNHLHGGQRGFDKVIWQAKKSLGEEEVMLTLTYTSPHMEEGYPGRLTCKVTYTLTANNELRIDYEARTDKTTIVNLTHHSYFNLAGVGAGCRDVLAHQMTIFADRYTPVDADLIPTGELRPVKGTPMDFRQARTIGSRLAKVSGGYDHNYVLNAPPGGEPALAAMVHEPTSGRVMEVLTTEPGLQFYTGNFLDGTDVGKGTKYGKHFGFCLEAQHFPDSPNQPAFPPVVLQPGAVYRQTTIYRFAVR